MFLGIDLGTSALKAIVTDAGGEIVAQGQAPLSVSNPQPLWSEQDPRQWWQALCKVLVELRRQCRLDGLQAIGVAGQMHGATLLDSRGRVLRPCILWNDGRCQNECQVLERALSDFRQRAGNCAMPGFTAPKLLWIKRHEPEVFAQLAKVLLPKDYLVFRLTGRYSSDMSDASGTLWLDPEKRQWDEALITAGGLRRDQLPELHEGCDTVGCVSAPVAAELGIAPAPVVAGAGDNAAGAVGMGIVQAGEGFVSLGTSGVYCVVSDRHFPAPENTLHAFCHCLPDTWQQMSVTLSAANCLTWLARQLGATEAQLVDELEQTGQRRTPVVFLPYLNGERTPHNDPCASGMFFGLRNETNRRDLTLAVLEGVAFSFVDGQDTLLSAHSHIDTVSLIGGGVRSRLWNTVLADVLGRPLQLCDGAAAGPGLGAARLAQLSTAAGNRRAALNQICSRPAVQAVYEPGASHSEYYAHKLATYRRLYTQTRELN